jgi:energy-coupling factor transporter ATP-binding protein EcfA2
MSEMKIKEISTRQFAGIKNRQMNFEDGLNIVVGENESGKSTMVEVIKQILFRRSVINRTKDKDFLINCMPSGGKGDVVDGRLVYEGKNGRCELQKRWGSKPDCELVDAGGNIIADEDTISGIIGEELVYKKGLYDDVVFASQKNQESVVEHILSRLDKNNEEKQDIVSILAAESMASAGGILPEDIERKISEKIEGLSGNWDFTINAPKGRRGIDKP